MSAATANQNPPARDSGTETPNGCSLTRFVMLCRDIPCQRPNNQCGNRKGNIVLNNCDICEQKHQHMRCAICGYEWNEWL
jgi:hypothetical protein